MNIRWHTGYNYLFMLEKFYSAIVYISVFPEKTLCGDGEAF